MLNVMIDLETLDTTSNALILAIGAVSFNEDGILREFYKPIDIQNSIKHEFSISADTLIWWMQQSNEAKAEMYKKGCLIIYALKDFTNWLRDQADINNTIVWGNGAAFDNVILANAYNKLGVTKPWSFWNDRCYRTVKAMSTDIDYEFVGTPHNALDDAKSQALHLIKILGELE